MKLVTIEEAAELMKCSRAAVYERMREPDFPPSAKIGKRRLFDADALEGWVRQKLLASGTPADAKPWRK